MAGQGCDAGSQAGSRGEHQDRIRGMAQEQLQQIKGQRWVGPQHDIPVDTLVLGQPTS